MATGDIKSVTVLGPDDYGGIFNGWGVEIGIEGLSTGGTYETGLGTNNNPSTAKISAAILGWQFTNAGVAEQSLQLSVYGTKESRKPYPDEVVKYETAATTDPDGYNGVKIIVALSEYVYAGDTAAGGIAAGLYTESENASLAYTAQAWTNNSTLTCPKCIANWSWPGYQRFTGDITLRAVGFHGSASGGKPLKQINFYLVSAGAEGSTTSKSVTVATIDSTMPDQNKVIEYVATWTAAELAAMGIPFEDGTFTADFEAIPLRTDSEGNGKLESDDEVNTGTTWKYKSQTHIYDATGAYGVTYAVVATDGVDANGTVGTSHTGLVDYATIGAAVRAICTYNGTNYSRKNAGAAIVYLKAGTHELGGTAASISDVTASDTWLTIRAYPGQSKSIVTIVGDPTTTDRAIYSSLTRFIDVTFGRAASETYWFRDGVGFSATTEFWVDACGLDMTGGSNSWIGTVSGPIYFTHNDMILIGCTMNAFMMRGNIVASSGNNTHTLRNIIGNAFVNTNASGAYIKSEAVKTLLVSNSIFAYNTLMAQSAQNILLNDHDLYGCAIVQNVFERIGASDASVILIDSSGTGIDPLPTESTFSHCLIMHNTVSGNRCNMSYNNEAAYDVPVRYPHWTEKNNILEYRAYKTDTFVPSANHVGNWSVGYGVATRGNIMTDEAFDREFSGLDLIEIDNTPAIYHAAVKFTDPQSYTSDNGGNGDYHLLVGSSAIGLASDWVLPYDLDGNARTAGGAAGAYAYADEYTSTNRNGWGWGNWW